MGVNSNQYLQGINQTTGTGAPTHSAVAGDRYTDTVNGNTYQYTTSWQSVSYSAGGLTYFTEAQSTSSPNATVNVDSLTAVASTTNADFVIKPKGSGAILRQIPDDGNSGGGSKRGTYAFDMQFERDAKTQVASGNGAIAFGGFNTVSSNIGCAIGSNNTVNNYYGIAIGYGNTCSGAYGVTLGASNISSGRSSLTSGTSNNVNSRDGGAFGNSNTISVDYSFAFGATNSISGGGEYSMAIGTSNSITTSNSVVLGKSGSANSLTKFIISSGSVGVAGSNQKGTLVLGNRTTDATPTLLYCGGISTSVSYQLLLVDNNSIRFKGTIIGRQSGSTNTSAWDIDGIIQRGVGVATTTLLISNVNVVQNTPSWGTPTLTADTANANLNIKVIGALSTNIQWTCAIDTTEVIYA